MQKLAEAGQENLYILGYTSLIYRNEDFLNEATGGQKPIHHASVPDYKVDMNIISTFVRGTLNKAPGLVAGSTPADGETMKVVALPVKTDNKEHIDTIWKRFYKRELGAEMDVFAGPSDEDKKQFAFYKGVLVDFTLPDGKKAMGVMVVANETSTKTLDSRRPDYANPDHNGGRSENEVMAMNQAYMILTGRGEKRPNDTGTTYGGTTLEYYQDAKEKAYSTEYDGQKYPMPASFQAIDQAIEELKPVLKDVREYKYVLPVKEGHLYNNHLNNKLYPLIQQMGISVPYINPAMKNSEFKGKYPVIASAKDVLGTVRD